MAFIKARKGDKIVVVSKSAYDKIFKPNGYRAIGEKEEVKEDYVPDFTDSDFDSSDYDPSGEEMDELETIPISDMNKSQLTEYALRHNIDTKGARNVSEARKIIQKAVRESKE